VNPPFPPPPQSPNMFSMATITLMIMITFIMQGSLIAASERWIKSYKGIREAWLATFSFALGFMAVAIKTPPGPVNGYISNLLITCGFFLIYLAICRFTESPFNRSLVYGVFPSGVLTLTLSAFVISQWLPMLFVSYVIGTIFAITTVAVLYYSDYQRYKLSAYLTAFPLSVYTLVMVGRLVAGLISRSEVTPGPSITGTTSALVLFISSFLWTSGFILMVSQRLHGDLDDLAKNDALTCVRNRRAMQEMLNFEMRRVDQEVRDFSIILLDIDHFKHVNDTYGHDVGDIVLQWLATTLQNRMRIQDVVARWGGEEFLILLPDTTLDEAIQIAERLREIVARSAIETPSGTLQITFSGGVACSTTSREVHQLCKIADQALYIAKETRNQVLSQDAIPAGELV